MRKIVVVWFKSSSFLTSPF